RRDGGAEIIQRGFVVRRPVGEPDQRLLARQRLHGGGIGNARRDPRRYRRTRSPAFGKPRPTTAGERQAGAGRAQYGSSREHGISSLALLFWLWRSLRSAKHAMILQHRLSEE